MCCLIGAQDAAWRPSPWSIRGCSGRTCPQEVGESQKLTCSGEQSLVSQGFAAGAIERPCCGCQSLWPYLLEGTPWPLISGVGPCLPGEYLVRIPQGNTGCCRLLPQAFPFLPLLLSYPPFATPTLTRAPFFSQISSLADFTKTPQRRNRKGGCHVAPDNRCKHQWDRR